MGSSWTITTSNIIVSECMPQLCWISKLFELIPYIISQHIKTKRQHLNLKVQQMSWLRGRKSKLSLENKILLYKCILKPIWTYGIQPWVCTKPSNKKVLQRFQSNVLCPITNVPWYVLNLTLHIDLQIPFVTEEIKKYSTIYHSRLIRHKNNQVTELSNPLHVKRRLRPQWLSDLIEERGEEEQWRTTA
jgi:hypothetical protein